MSPRAIAMRYGGTESLKIHSCAAAVIAHRAPETAERPTYRWEPNKITHVKCPRKTVWQREGGWWWTDDESIHCMRISGM